MSSGGTDTLQRHIRLPNTSNLRDFGGYPGADGRRIRWRQFYRSGAMPRLAEADWAWMREQGISVVCDLRTAAERELGPTLWQGPEHTRHIHADYDAEIIFGVPFQPSHAGGVGNDMHKALYVVFADLLAPVFTEMFEALLDQQVPLIVHCSAGQDRTGLAVGLLLTLLGTDRETIYADYLLSTELRRTENEVDRSGIAASAGTNVFARYYTDALRNHGAHAMKPARLVDSNGNALLRRAFVSIEEKFGGIEQYAEQCLKVDAKAVARLRELYLEPRP